jgi:guanylate kinase
MDNSGNSGSLHPFHSEGDDLSRNGPSLGGQEDCWRPPTSPPLLFVLSGPSGVGKDAVLASLRALALPLHFTVTATTRAPRPGEIDGVSYHFWSRDRFALAQAEKQLLESAEVHGNHYGTPLEQVREALQAGQDAILKIDVQGAAQVKLKVPEAVFIFLAPPSLEDLISRLRGRGTESESEFQRRVRDAHEEMRRWPEYDYVVVNRDGCLDEAVEKVRAIIVAEKCRSKPRRIQL